jgi:hypothetical protein
MNGSPYSQKPYGQSIPRSLFWFSFLELDARKFTGSGVHDLPLDDIREFFVSWVEGLEPDTKLETNEWHGNGVRLKAQVLERGPSTRGVSIWPSMSLLEPRLPDVHFVEGERRQLISLTLDEVQLLASGELRLVGQLASSPSVLRMMAEEMQRFGYEQVADMHPYTIQTYASMLGLIEAHPDLGSFDMGWRGLNRVPPEG